MNNPFIGLINNNVLPLSVLKNKNYPLFKYYLGNRSYLKRRLASEGVEVLNDLYTKNTYTNIKLYLRYYYGDTVEMNVLRKKDRTVYNYISKIGPPMEVLTEMGFTPVYIGPVRSLEYFKAELDRAADEDGYIYKIQDEKLYAKISYRAKKEKVTIAQYLETLGFKHGLNKKRLLALHEQGLNPGKIGELLRISRSSVVRELEKAGKGKKKE